MNRGITKENLLLILPPALSKDKSVMALAEVDAEALAARPAEIDKARVIANIDGLDEAVLDILARDFKVDWWDPEYSIEEKRRTLKGSWRVHKILGTKAAVETAISAIYPGTKVQEWWEYGGEPFYFRLFLNAGNLRPDTEKYRRVLERVNYYKSLRSHLDGFIWNFTGEPFPETPGRLIFRRFAIAWAFSNLRSFPPLRLDGSVPLDGSALLNAAPASLFGFPRFRVSGETPGVRDKMERTGIWCGFTPFSEAEKAEMPEFRARVPTAGNQRGPAALSTPLLRMIGGMEKNKQIISRAALIVDTMYTLDGAVLLDGSRELNAEIRQEDL